MFEKLGKHLDDALAQAADASKVFGDMAKGAIEKVKELVPDPAPEPEKTGVSEHVHPTEHVYPSYDYYKKLSEVLQQDASLRVEAIRQILVKLGNKTPHESGIYIGNMYTLQQLRADLLKTLGEGG